MGITLHYRGKIDDISAIEALEDRVIDLVLAFGGQVRVWRSVADDDPRRIVRGLIVNLEPGQESFSLLFSPEGFLIPLTVIEEAEKHPLTEPPWCFVKTQFGTVEGHAALVETLSELKKQFIPQLEVSDEGEYWTHRDPIRLATFMQQTAKMIDAMAQGLTKHPLSHEAIEDPEIVATRVTRVAQMVQQAFRQQEKETAKLSDEYSPDWIDIESQWDELYRAGAARTLRMQRLIESKLLAGKSAEEALESALAEIVGEQTNVAQEKSAGAQRDQDVLPLDSTRFFDQSTDEVDRDKPWEESSDVAGFDDPPNDESEPLLERATQL